MKWRPKVGSRVEANKDLKAKSSTSGYRGTRFVQGGDYEWLKNKPIVIWFKQSGTIVAIPPTSHKYQAHHRNGEFVVHWDNGLVTAVMGYDLTLG